VDIEEARHLLSQLVQKDPLRRNIRNPPKEEEDANQMPNQECGNPIDKRLSYR
jgi:hypothetical protein